MIIIKVQDFYKRCGVREKGKDFYNNVKKIIPPNTKELRFDFENVTFVSTSFLDESIFRFHKKYDISIVARKTNIRAKANRYSKWYKIKLNFNEESGIIYFPGL